MTARMRCGAAQAGMVLGLLMFAVGWFVPIHRYGKTLLEALPGWEAFLIALSPIWQKADPWRWYDSALSIGSALTKLVIVALPFGWARRHGAFCPTHRLGVHRLPRVECPVGIVWLGIRIAGRLLSLVALIWPRGHRLFAPITRR